MVTASPKYMIFHLVRKCFDKEKEEDYVSRKSISIQEQIYFHCKNYSLRSIVYFEGDDEVVHGHHACHCLVEYKQKVSRRQHEVVETFGQWFKMNDNCVKPITPHEAVHSPQVKKGFTILIYEKTSIKLKVPESINPNWNKGTSRLPPSTQDIGHNCFLNVIVQALAFCDLQFEVNCFLERTYCNETSANKKTHNTISCENGNTLLSNFPTRFHKDFFWQKNILLIKH